MLQHTITPQPGVSLAVHDVGSGGLHTCNMVFAHANGFHSRCLDDMIGHLPDRFVAASYDHRGHGASLRPDGWTFDWSDLADDAVAVTERLDTPVVGFGHSMGGAVLLLAAQRRPDLFAALVTFEPIAFPPVGGLDDGDDENPMAAGALRRRNRFASREEAFDNYRRKPPLALIAPSVLQAYVDHGLHPDDDGFTLACAPQTEADAYTSAGQNGVWQALPNINTRVLVLGGEVTPFAPGMLAEPIAERLPNGVYHGDESWHHLQPFIDPAKIAAATSAFLSPFID